MLFGTAVKLGILRPRGTAPPWPSTVTSTASTRAAWLAAASSSPPPWSAGSAWPASAAYEKQAGGTSGPDRRPGSLGAQRVRRRGRARGAPHPARRTSSPARVRKDLNQRIGLGLVVSYLPDDKGVRFALAFGFHAAPPRREAAGPATAVEAPLAVAEAEPTLVVGDRPQFRLRIRATDPALQGEPRHLQYAPYQPLATSKLGAPPPPPGHPQRRRRGHRPAPRPGAARPRPG